MKRATGLELMLVWGLAFIAGLFLMKLIVSLLTYLTLPLP